MKKPIWKDSTPFDSNSSVIRKGQNCANSKKISVARGWSGRHAQTEHARMCYCSCSVIKSCWTLCDPMDCSMPDYPVLHHLPELTQTHVHWVDDAIKQSSPLPLSSPPALIFPIISIFSNELALPIRWPKNWSLSIVLPKNIQHCFPLGLTGLISLLFKGFSRVFPNTTGKKH